MSITIPYALPSNIGLSPEPNYAAAVVAAENDVIVEDWLPCDPRFRASLTISPADPNLAAREIHRLLSGWGFSARSGLRCRRQ